MKSQSNIKHDGTEWPFRPFYLSKLKCEEPLSYFPNNWPLPDFCIAPETALCLSLLQTLRLRTAPIGRSALFRVIPLKQPSKVCHAHYLASVSACAPTQHFSQVHCVQLQLNHTSLTSVWSPALSLFLAHPFFVIQLRDSHHCHQCNRLFPGTPLLWLPTLATELIAGFASWHYNIRLLWFGLLHCITLLWSSLQLYVGLALVPSQ